MAEGPPRLYVGNLPYVAQRADIERLFEDNDIAVANIDISIDPFTGRNPSYCFVDFHNAAEANRALTNLQGTLVRGRPVKLNHKTERRGNFAGSRRPTKTYDRGWGAQKVPTMDVNPQTAYVYDRWSRTDAQSRFTKPTDEERRLYVGGLPQIPNQDSLNAEMRSLFQGFNIEAVSKIISPNDVARRTPGSHRYCFVDLPSKMEAEDAVAQLDGTETPYGGQYKVKISREPRRPTKVMREQLGITEQDWKARSRSPPKRNLERDWRTAELY